jgi:hypothetical protein
MQDGFAIVSSSLADRARRHLKKSSKSLLRFQVETVMCNKRWKLARSRLLMEQNELNKAHVSRFN